MAKDFSGEFNYSSSNLTIARIFQTGDDKLQTIGVMTDNLI
jgi:hypothetical protein